MNGHLDPDLLNALEPPHRGLSGTGHGDGPTGRHLNAALARMRARAFSWCGARSALGRHRGRPHPVDRRRGRFAVRPVKQNEGRHVVISTINLSDAFVEVADTGHRLRRHRLLEHADRARGRGQRRRGRGPAARRPQRPAPVHGGHGPGRPRVGALPTAEPRRPLPGRLPTARTCRQRRPCPRGEPLAPVCAAGHRGRLPVRARVPDADARPGHRRLGPVRLRRSPLRPGRGARGPGPRRRRHHRPAAATQHPPTRKE